MHHSRVAKHPEISEIIQIIVLLFELYILKHIIFILKPIICCFSKNLSPFYYTLLYALYILFIYSSITNSSCLLFLSTVLSDEDTGPPNHDDEQDPPAGMRTPPTPPPPSSPIPGRVRAIAQLRPVSIPDIVRDIAGSNPQQRIAAFDRHYMPDGVPAPEASVQGNAEDHRADLKRKADGISRSLSDVFAYLTYNTTSQNEVKKLLTIIHNVCFYTIHIFSN